MIFKLNGYHYRPLHDVSKGKCNAKHKPIWFAINGSLFEAQIAEPLGKRLARHGVKQSDLNYGGVR
jgi:uncharacterized protein YigE (DUF2233 family)